MGGRRLETLCEYVLLDSQRIAVEVYRRAGEQWTRHSFGPGDEVTPESITTSIPASAFYERIALERT